MSVNLVEVPTSDAAEQINLLNLPPGSKATEVALTLPRMKFEQWEQITLGLITTEGSSQWLIGDALLFGRTTFGEDYAQVIDVEKLKRTDEATIRGYLWVSEKVPSVLRRTKLRWYHHKEVARLSHPEQKAWLERAETLGWTVRELRAHIREVEDDSDAENQEPDANELEVLQDPAVRQFLDEHKTVLRARRDIVPHGVPSIMNLIDAQIGHAQWQLDRTPSEESARVLDAIDEGWQIGTEIFNWLQRRCYFMREPELRERLAQMCEGKKLLEVKQGGRKDNQRGDLTSMYVKYDAKTGDSLTLPKANGIYGMGSDEDE